MITSLEQVLERAKAQPPCRLVVAGANHDSTLAGVIQARRSGLIETAVLIDDGGSFSAIGEYLKRSGECVGDYDFAESSDEAAVAACAVDIVSQGEDDLLLKGRISSATLLGAVLASGKEGLRRERSLSDVLITENPRGDAPRLIGIADGGVNIAPDIDMKRRIIDNAVDLFHRLGIETPLVAVLCAIERVTGAMPHTIEAQWLAQLNRDGEIKGCLVEGPLALDVALCPEAARIKGIESVVAGRADILIAPTIEAGNILGKSFRYLAHKPMAHVIEGAAVPILIPSRAESAEDKLYSIALGAICSR